MKKVTHVLSVFAAFLSPLMISCADDNDVNRVYDLRPLSRLIEEFGSTTKDRPTLTSHKKSQGHVFSRSEQNLIPRARGALLQESASNQETYTYEYGYTDHLGYGK